MRSRITLILDCPLENCDKTWLFDELKIRTDNIGVICPKKRLSKYLMKGMLGKLKYSVYFFLELIKSVLKIRKTDVFIIWSLPMGLILNKICMLISPKKKIISFNWLTPNKKSKIRNLIQVAMNNKNLMAIANSTQSIQLYKLYYGDSCSDKFCLLPDAFDSSEPFSLNDFSHKSDYFFTGGMNNRDFSLILQVAERIPDYRFVIVALKEQWSFGNDMPKNVKVYFNTSHDEYYELMKKSRAVLLPLKDQRAAGLINICKSLQYGVICVTTRTPATESYYAEESEKYLIEIGDEDQLERVIYSIVSYNESNYKKEVWKMQEYLKKNVSPSAIVEEMLRFAEKYYGNPIL